MDSGSNTTSVVRLLGMQTRAECGYCKMPDRSQFLAMRAERLACADYQQFLDRGWRRSGTLLYLTDHSNSCCAYYTIRTHALEYRLTGTDKKLVRKVRKGERSNAAADDRPKDILVSKVCGGGVNNNGRLEVKLERAGFSEAKYRIFEQYQNAVHGDPATRSGFTQFLCHSPLVPEGDDFGSFHQCYYIDGQLAAFGVVDILPSCVSSVYLCYDPAYGHLSLGSFSSLREIALVRQLNERYKELKYYYMGYYVPTCPKMTYKARWRPAELLDLLTYQWIPLDRCLQRIQEHPVFCTFDPSVDDRGVVRDRIDDVMPVTPGVDPGILNNSEVQVALDALKIDIGVGVGAVRAADLARLSEDLEELALQTYVSVGGKLTRGIKFYL